MTCIVGLVQGGRVWMGGDSAGMDGRYALQVRADRKVFRSGAFLFGFTSSFRMGNLLQHSLEVPRYFPGDDVFKFMVVDFVNAVRDCLKKGGYARKENEEESGGAFLVGFQGRLFQIHEDYQVGESTAGYAAVGCGDLIALGALFATPDRPPEERLLAALKAAEQFSGGVRAPFTIVSSDEVAR